MRCKSGANAAGVRYGSYVLFNGGDLNLIVSVVDVENDSWVVFNSLSRDLLLPPTWPLIMTSHAGFLFLSSPGDISFETQQCHVFGQAVSEEPGTGVSCEQLAVKPTYP